MTDTPIAVFIGAPASGKSRAAKKIAEVLGVRLIDTDSVIEERHGIIKDIFDNEGEAAFRSYEREVVRESLTQPAIVSLGGGAILDEDTQAQLSNLPVIWLKVSAEAVADRVNNPKRPLLAGGIETWKQLVAQRTPIYEKLAKVTFDSSSGDVEKVGAEILQWISQQNQGGAS